MRRCARRANGRTRTRRAHDRGPAAPGSRPHPHRAAPRRPRSARRPAPTARESRCRAPRPAKSARATQVEREARSGTGAAVRLADVVVAAAPRDRVRHAVDVGAEHRTAVICIAAQVAEIDRHFGTFRLCRELRQIVERPRDFGQHRQACACLGEHACVAIEMRQRAQRGARIGTEIVGGSFSSGTSLPDSASYSDSPRSAACASRASSAASTPAWPRSRRMRDRPARCSASSISCWISRSASSPACP